MKQHVFHVKVMSDSFCDPMVCIPPGSSVHGISQAEVLEWVVISSCRGSSWPRDWTHVSCGSHTAGGFFTIEPLTFKILILLLLLFFFVLCCQPVSPIYEQPTQALNHGKCEQWHGALWIPGFTSCRPSTSLGSSTIMLSSSPLYGISRILACTSSSDTNLKLSVCFIICTGLLVSCNEFMCKRMPSEH